MARMRQVFPAPAGMNRIKIGKSGVGQSSIVFPAPAGMNRAAPRCASTLSGVPRACGDEPWMEPSRNEEIGCFPAPAGMNRFLCGIRVAIAGVPRACGDEPSVQING